MSFPILEVLIFLPVIASLTLAALPKKWAELVLPVSWVASIVQLGLSIYLWFWANNRTPNVNGYFLEKNHSWIKAIGARFYLAVDGMSINLVLLSTLLTIVGLCISQNQKDRTKAFCVWLFLLEASVVAAFMAGDIFYFFTVFELGLIPMFFLISGWGHGRAQYAATKFLIYTMAGSVTLLVGMLWLSSLYEKSVGHFSYNVVELVKWVNQGGLSHANQIALFIMFFVAFAVKAPLIPFHTWLPDAHTQAPTAGSVDLAGLMLKLGSFAMIRFAYPLFPYAAQKLAPYVMAIAAFGVVYTAIISTMQNDVKRLIAYSSVSHMGIIIIGIASGTIVGLNGAIFSMISHGLTTGAMFCVIGLIYDRYHTRNISELAGLWITNKQIALYFIIAGLASIGVPGLSGFIGEFLSLLGGFNTVNSFYSNRIFMVIGIVATLGIIFAALYMLWAFQRIFSGQPSEIVAKAAKENPGKEKLALYEHFAIAPMLILSLVLGFVPSLILGFGR